MPFVFHRTQVPEIIEVEPRVFGDERGFFLETFAVAEFAAAGIVGPFVQDNHSRSVHGVLRGLHYQRAPHAQGKLVRCTVGVVWDVGADIRPGSATHGRWVGRKLSADNHRMLWIPPGFAHGFVTLSDVAEVQYKTTAPYAPEADDGIRWDDPTLAIDWPLTEPILSSKDQALPYLAEVLP